MLVFSDGEGDQSWKHDGYLLFLGFSGYLTIP